MTPAVEFRVADGRFADVRVGEAVGVRPASAREKTLATIAAGLTGYPADLGVPSLAAIVRTAVPFGVELVGTTPTAIAEEIRCSPLLPPVIERIGSQTPAEIDRLTAGWRSLPWRIIPERPLSPALNVALDEVLTDRVSHGTRPPTLRFWGWDGPAVVLGRCQSVVNEVDAAAAAERGMAVVRRMSGGGAMFVRPGGVVTYSLYLPESALAGLSIRRSYEVCEAWVVRGLRSLGVDAHHVPANDIAWAGGKIGGAAQARRRGVVLHHTTMAYQLDTGEMADVLRLGRPKVKERGVTSAAKVVSPLAEQTALPRETVVQRLTETFRASYGGDDDGVTDKELAAAERLVTEKYGTAPWTHDFE